MSFVVNKRYPLLFGVMCLIICIGGIVFVLTFSRSFSNNVVTISAMSSAGVFAIIRYCQDLKASFTVTNDYFHYVRAGLNVKVSWDNICRIEYSNNMKVKALDCMILYCGQGKLYIDYTVEGYIELWTLIIRKCEQQPDDTTIDPQLYTVVSQRHKRQGTVLCVDEEQQRNDE